MAASLLFGLYMDILYYYKAEKESLKFYLLIVEYFF